MYIPAKGVCHSRQKLPLDSYKEKFKDLYAEIQYIDKNPASKFALSLISNNKVSYR